MTEAGEKVAAAVYAALERQQDRRHRDHLGCSQLGRPCSRDIWYGWRWASEISHPGRVLRLFRRGQDEEERVVEDLRSAGLEVHDRDPETGQQFRVLGFGGHLGGSLDGACRGIPGRPTTWAVLEIKTSGAKPFKKLKASGVRVAKPEHFAQMQLYMEKTGMRLALYFAVCKDNDELYAEVVAHDQAEARQLLAKAEAILNADQPPPKIAESPAWFQCKWCDHRRHCHGEDAPLANCRTCVHATPELEEGEAGRWICEKLCRPLSHDEQERGCQHHLYLPGLLNFAEVVEADPAGRWIEYKSEQGVHFRNGIADNQEEPLPWPSQNLAELGARVLTDDPLLESIRRTFGPVKIEK